MQQLPLGIKWRYEDKLSNFICSDERFEQTIHSFAQNNLPGLGLYMYGPNGAGKSHLVHGLAHAGESLGARTAVISFGTVQLAPAVLEGLEQCELVCLDNLHVVTSDRSWAEALFRFFNAMQDRRGRIVVSALQAPALIECALPDLRSRLQGLVTVQVPPLTDESRKRLLVMRGEQKGLKVSEEVAQFLLARFSRDTIALIHVIDTLDKASLQEQRRLTVPFVKQVLSV